MKDKKLVVKLLDEAVNSGARLYKACDILNITARTYNRWKKLGFVDKRKGSIKSVPRKLTSKEQNRIEKIACSKRFVDSTPYEIVAELLDDGIYIASVRSFYRVLKERKLINHRRGDRAASKKAKPPERVATGPNQVYSWDITWLKSEVSGKYYYAYMVMDVWSRKIVTWEVHDKESQDLSEEMFRNLNSKLSLSGIKLHSDNGNPMKGATIISTLQSLGITPSFSRPRVSDDNPYSEALFKTLKYKVNYPNYFDGIERARIWIANFVDWYNTKHKHSGIGMITPEQRHTGKGDKIMKKRNKIMLKAYMKNPTRWSKEVKLWVNIKKVYLNPSDETKEQLGKAS